MLRLLTPLLLGLFWVFSSSAQLVPEQTLDRYESRYESYMSLVNNGDIGSALEYLPPAMYNELVLQSGVPEAELKSMSNQIWATAIASIEIDNWKIEPFAMPALKTTNGLEYRVIPIYFEATVKANPNIRLKSTSEMLAFRENSEWYFVRLSDPQSIAMFQKHYPELSKVEVQAQKIEPIIYGGNQ